MKATIRDPGTLSALKPLEVVSYLRAAGWSKLEEQSGRWATWVRNQDDEEFEIALPLTTQYRDFALRMSDVLQVLEAVEKRSQPEIWRDLLLTSADVVQVRLTDSDLADGSLPLEEAAGLVQKATDMMLAAACAAVGPRAYFPSKRPGPATEYLRQIRLRQTEGGSFGLTILSRVPPSLAADNGQFLELEEPFERRVTQTLAKSLTSVRTACEKAASTGKVESFVSAVSQGVSANLCDALVGMGTGGDAGRSLQISLSWARHRPLDPRRCVAGDAFFPPDAFPLIQEAGVYLKESTPREEFEARGPVVKLERADGTPTGKVTIHCFVDDQARKVSVDLPESQYHDAVTAHDSGSVVRCLGVLTREGRSFRLHDCYGFSVEPSE
jgi:hypothetical protein